MYSYPEVNSASVGVGGAMPETGVATGNGSKENRGTSDESPPAPAYLVHVKGRDTELRGAWLRWEDDDSGETLPVQHLLAIAEGADPHVIFDDSTTVEFKDGRRDHLVGDNIEVKRKPWQEREKLARAAVANSTIDDIAADLNCSRRTVEIWLDRHGLVRKWDSEAGWYVIDEDTGDVVAGDVSHQGAESDHA